jgi:hypothetical protein
VSGVTAEEKRDRVRPFALFKDLADAGTTS